MPSETRSRRRYSDAFRAGVLAALDANGGDVARTAREMRVPRKTLEGWASGRHNPVEAELRREKKGELADVLDGWVRRLCRIDVGDLSELNLQQVAVAVGIAVEKLLLLRQQPTSISRDESAATFDVSRLSVADLETLLDLQHKAEGRPPMLYAGDPNNPDAVVVEDDVSDQSDSVAEGPGVTYP